MRDGQAFDQNDETRAEELRVITISAALLWKGTFNMPAEELSRFFHDSLPVMLHYLRPVVEEGNADAEVLNNYALGLYGVAKEYFGEDAICAPGYCPIPEALFWFRQCSRREELDRNHPLIRIEIGIRKNCAQCRADLPEGKQSCCVECKAAYYCNRDCQVAHWKAGHKKECVRKLKKRVEG